MATFSITDQTRRAQYTANGSTTEFSFSFQVNNTSEIKVFWGTTQKTESTHYDIKTSTNSLGLNTDGTGKVVFRTSPSDHTPPNTTVVTIISDIPMARTSVYTAGGNITAASLENDFDTLVMKLASHEERLDRGMVAPVNDAVNVDLTLPDKDTRKGRVLGFNATTGAPEAGPEIADVQSLANVTADIQTLAHIEDGTDATDAIQTVASNATNVNTVAGISANVTTVAGISSNVTSVAGNSSNINTVAGNNSNINTVAGNNSNISTVAGISSNVTSVAGIASNVTSVAGVTSSVSALAATDVLADMAALNTTDVLADLAALGETSVIANMAQLGTASVVSNMAQLGTSSIVADIQALADIEDGTTATDAISTVAANVTNVNNFANRYRIGTSNPASNNDEGDLFYNTTTNQMLVYNGGAWVALNANDAATLTVFSFTATAGQTAFTGADSGGTTLNYNTSNFIVTLNGIILPSEDFTATSATVFTLDADAAADVGDVLQIYSFTSFTVSQPFLANANGNHSLSTVTDGLTSTLVDAGSSEGPDFRLERDSSSPATNDALGLIRFNGKNSADSSVTYASVRGQIGNTTNTSEKGNIQLRTKNGSGFRQVTIDGVNNRLQFDSEQTLYWENHKGTSFDCTLDWDTPSANSSVKLPNATGAIGHLAFDSQAVTTTDASTVQFQNIPDRFSDAEIYFRCGPATDAQQLLVTFNNTSGAEITTADAYEWYVNESGTARTGTATSSMQISGNSVGTDAYEGVSGRLVLSGLRNSHANGPLASIFGEFTMFNSSGAFKAGTFHGSLNPANAQEVGGIRFNWSSGNFESRFFRAYGLRNTE